MKKSILALLIYLSLLLSCAERKGEPNATAVPQATVDSSPPINTRSEPSPIAKERAVKLATAAAKRMLGSLEKYEVISSELDNGWLVTIQLRKKSPMITGGAVDYFIDKEGEKIIDVKLYQ